MGAPEVNFGGTTWRRPVLFCEETLKGPNIDFTKVRTHSMVVVHGSMRKFELYFSFLASHGGTKVSKSERIPILISSETNERV